MNGGKNASGVGLTWTAVSTPVFIEQSDDGGADFSIIDEVDAGATSYTDSTVSDGTAYVYEVASVAGDGYDANPSSGIDVTTPIAAPSGLTATANGQNEVDLSWTNNSQVATGYTIERSTDGSTYTQVGTVGYADDSFFSDTGLTAGTTYYYRVLATADSLSPSDPSSEVVAVTDYPPPTFSIYGSSTSYRGQSYTINFEHTYGGIGDPITGWSIDWGDGSTPTTLTSDAASATHTYTTSGTFLIQAIPSTADGPLSPAAVNTVNVAVPAPTLSLESSSATVAENENVTLNPVYTDDYAGGVSTYWVDWGDGTSYADYGGSSTAFTHQYAHGGTNYKVEIFGVTSVGVVATSATITVTGSNPITTAGTHDLTFSTTDATRGGSPIVGDSMDATITGSFDANSDTVPGSGGSESANYDFSWNDPHDPISGTLENQYETDPTATPTGSYMQDGQYLESLVSTDGEGFDQTQFVNVSNLVPALGTIPDQITGVGQTFTMTEPITNLSPDLSNAVAFVDLGDGSGPQPATVTVSGSTGTISISVPAPRNYGTYTGTVTLYPMAPTGTSSSAGPTYAVSQSFNLYVWGAEIHNGEANDLLIASPDGTQNLQNVVLNCPHPSGDTYSVTITDSDPTEDYIWIPGTASAGTTPACGGTASASYTVSVTGTSLTYQIADIAGDTTAGCVDAQFSGSQTSGPTATSAGSASLSDSATTITNAASNLSVALSLDSDPNTDAGANGTGAHPYNFIIGQMVNLTATIRGPADANNAYRSDWLLPGNVLAEYNDSKTSASTVAIDLAEGGIPAPQPNGTSVEHVSFFWVSTAYDPQAAAGPDADTIQYTAINQANSTLTASVTLSFNVYSAIPQALGVSHGKIRFATKANDHGSWDRQVGLFSDDTAPIPLPDGIGIAMSAAVQTPTVGGASVFGQGSFKFVQLVKPKYLYNMANAAQPLHSRVFGTVGLDSDGKMNADPMQAYSINALFGTVIVNPFNSPNHDAYLTDDGSRTVSDSPNSTMETYNGRLYQDIVPREQSLIANDNFQAFVMYRPPGAGSQWVPLVVENWRVSYTASRRNPAPAQVGNLYREDPYEILNPDVVTPAYIRATYEPVWPQILTPTDTLP